MTDEITHIPSKGYATPLAYYQFIGRKTIKTLCGTIVAFDTRTGSGATTAGNHTCKKCAKRINK